MTICNTFLFYNILLGHLDKIEEKQTDTTNYPHTIISAMPVLVIIALRNKQWEVIDFFQHCGSM